VFAATDSAFKRCVPSEADKREALRDWFAGMAMQGLLANPNEIPSDEVVRGAYRYADAMIRERKEGGK
jgi:hypothetical protein